MQKVIALPDEKQGSRLKQLWDGTEEVQGQARERSDGCGSWLEQAELEGLHEEDQQLYAGCHLYVGGG